MPGNIETLVEDPSGYVMLIHTVSTAISSVTSTVMFTKPAFSWGSGVSFRLSKYGPSPSIISKVPGPVLFQLLVSFAQIV